MADDDRLLAALAVIRARGAIGEQSLPDAVAHADRFVGLIPQGPLRVVDLGSGGGLPAMVIAWRRDDVHVVMVERRSARADLLRRAVSALALGDRVTVFATDVAEVCSSQPRSFDVVTARSFAEPQVTAAIIDALLVCGGIALVSEPPQDRSAKWAAALAGRPQLADDGVDQGIRVLSRRC